MDAETLRLLYWQAPTALNPHLTSASKDWEAARLVYEPLASFNSEGNLIPFLAAEIPSQENGGVAEDGRSITWTLKEGVQWADGEPFTADDVRFTYEFITNPDVSSNSLGVYANIASVDVIDDLTVRINFQDVTPIWARPFVGITGVILPEHIFADYNGSNASEAPANLLPIGTGPFYATEFSAEDIIIVGNDVVETVKITYEANPYFREPDRPFFERVELRGGGDAEVAARAVLEDGTVDYGWNLQVDATTLQSLAENGSGNLLDNPLPSAERLLINHSDPNEPTADAEFSSTQFPHPFFSDLLVRQAFAHAIDRQAIAQIYGISGRSTNNVMVAWPLFQDPQATVPTSYNLETARSLLAEAGWYDRDGDGIRDKDGTEMQVLMQTTVNPLREQVLDIVKNSLEQIGVDVEIKIIDPSIFGNRTATNINSAFHFYADMQLLAWSDTNPDPANYLSFWTCERIPQRENEWAGFNFERWCNPMYDALLAEAATEVDPERRRELLTEAASMLSNQVVTIPLIQRSFVSAASEDIQGIELTPWDSDVWLIKDWRRVSP
jgi:peptide/nickel transport system substrate-binding protein